MGNGVTTIGYEAFGSCISLTGIIIPDSVTCIGLYAFSNCFRLASVTFGSNITIMAVGVFHNCDSLNEIHFKGTKEQWQAIEKQHDWNHSKGQYIIYCTDGILEKGAY